MLVRRYKHPSALGMAWGGQGEGDIDGTGRGAVTGKEAEGGAVAECRVYGCL